MIKRSLVGVLLGTCLSPFMLVAQDRQIRQESIRSSCSNIVALAGSANVNCSSLTPQQQKIIEEIPSLLKKILVNQLDPSLVMAKLDQLVSISSDLKAAVIPREVPADKNSPLRFSGYLQRGNYPEGMVIAGIVWKDNFSDVRLDLQNRSEFPIENLDFFVALDTHISEMRQLEGMPDVTLSGNTGPMISITFEGTDQNGRPIAMPVIPTGPTTSPVYRVSCPKLLGLAAIRLMAASVTLNPIANGSLPEKLFAPKRDPRSMRIWGSYEVKFPGSPTRYPFNETISLQQ